MEPRRFLFVMWEGGGNVPPQLGLARKLVARGHLVRVLTEPSVRRDVLATGASYGSFASAPHRQDRSPGSDLVRDFDARTPVGALAATRDRVMFGPARAYAQDTLAKIERFGPHVLAVDWVLTGAAVAGEAAGVPTVLLMHGNNLLPEPGKPAPGFGFLPARSALGRVRDRLLTWVFLRLLDKGLPALNEARLALGLPPLGHVMEQFEQPARFLCLYPEAFDLPTDRHAAPLRYVGPVLEQPAWAEPWSPPWPLDDQRPLVVVSMSTSYMRQERTLQRCVEAVSLISCGLWSPSGPRWIPPPSMAGRTWWSCARRRMTRCSPTPARSSPMRVWARSCAPWPTACRWSVCPRAGTSTTSRPGSAGTAPVCASDRARPRPGSARRCTGCCTSRRSGKRPNDSARRSRPTWRPTGASPSSRPSPPPLAG
jgi:hypothetical protein